MRHLFVAVIASIISYASRVSTDILTNIMQASLRCCSRFFSAAFSSHPSSLHPGIPAHVPSFSPIIPRAIPHNSKCRYGERGAVAARPKAQIILDVLSSILATQMPCRTPSRSEARRSATAACGCSWRGDPPERCLSRKAGIVRCCPRKACAQFTFYLWTCAPAVRYTIGKPPASL